VLVAAADGGRFAGGEVAVPAADGGEVAPGGVVLPAADGGELAAGGVAGPSGDGGLRPPDRVELPGHEPAGGGGVPLGPDGQVVRAGADVWGTRIIPRGVVADDQVAQAVGRLGAHRSIEQVEVGAGDVDFVAGAREVHQLVRDGVEFFLER